MTLRCLIAFTRFVWGVEPAFYQISTPIKEADAMLLCFGALLDIGVVLGVGSLVVMAVQQIRSSKKGD